MKKGVWLVLLLMVSVMTLAGCGPASNSGVEAWSEKDFAFYNAAGRQKSP